MENFKNKDVLSEFIGTYILVFIGVGSIVVNKINGSIGNLGIALSFGLVVYFCINIFSASSGAHFNPVVTVILYFSGKCTFRSSWMYIIAQLSGASIASLCLKLVFGDSIQAGITQVIPQLSIYDGIFIEIIMTFFLIISILITNNSIIIGIAIFLDAFIGGPVTGASMNPARSFGPALVMFDWNEQWLYWIAPLLGGFFALFCSKLVMNNRPATQRSEMI